MKRFLILSFLSLTTAHSACDYEIRDQKLTTPEQQKAYRCEQNLKCTIAVIKEDSTDLFVLETLGDYSLKNNCNNNLKLMAMMEEMMAADLKEFEEASVNNDERGNTKTDLPIIPDAPSIRGSRTNRQ